MFWTIVLILAFLFVCVLLSAVMVYKSETEERMMASRTNVVVRIEEILERSAYHRLMLEELPEESAPSKYHTEQLEAEADEFVALHGYHPRSAPGFVLAGCVVCGHDYQEALTQLLKAYK